MIRGRTSTPEPGDAKVRSRLWRAQPSVGEGDGPGVGSCCREATSEPDVDSAGCPGRQGGTGAVIRTGNLGERPAGEEGNAARTCDRHVADRHAGPTGRGRVHQGYG